MAHHRLSPRGATALGLLWAATAAWTLGCASAPPPPPAPEPPPPPAAAAPAAVPETKPPTVVVIDAGGAKPAPGLAAAGRAAKEDREGVTATVKVTNDNLKSFQDGQVTFAKPKTPSASELVPAPPVERGEAYWRQRLFDLRLRGREARDQVTRLEGQVATLRRSFYAAADPYERDGRIKPAWDHALEELDRSRKLVETLRAEVATALEEGRRAGAQPGWLREGTDLENDLPLPPDPGAGPVEPPVVEFGDPPR